MCGRGVRIILLFPLVARCLESLDVCIWLMLVFMSVVATVWGLWEVCGVSAIVKDSDFFSLGLLKYGVGLSQGCDGCCVFCMYCDAWSCRCSCMGSMSISSCTCCMFVSCVHPVAVSMLHSA